jgi:multiple sugar transport system permease protein
MTTIHKQVKSTNFKRQQGIFVLSVLIPMAIIFLTFWIYPLLSGFYGSLTRWQGFSNEQPFVGFQHYIKLASDPTFIKSLVNTFKYAVVYVPLDIIIALIVALAIENSGKMRTIFRTIYFLPVVTSEIATGLVWAYLFQPSLGLFNQVFRLLGLPTQRFLLSTDQALFCIIGYAIWKTLGYNMILFMAGLNGIPKVFKEAAQMDGANRWTVFSKITLPLLSPTMVFVLITGLINTLQVFAPIFVMTAREANSAPGGPLNSTMVVAIYQWQIAFREMNLGYGAAMSVVLFLIIMVITAIQVPLLKTKWDY